MKTKEQKAYINEYNRRPENKAKKKAYDKKYREKNREKKKIQDKKYYQENLEHLKEYEQSPERKKKHRERMKIYSKKPEVKLHQKRYIKHRFNTNTIFRIKHLLRTRLGFVLRNYTKNGKVQSSSKYGINYKAIIEHLKPFPEDISLYHVDHIKPLCSFNLEDPEEIKKAFAPENHQWLTIQENRSKGGKINY